MEKKSLIVSVVGALVVGFLIFLFLSAQKHTVSVVVAARDLPAGAVITENDVEVREIPSKAVRPGAFPDVEAVVGQVLTVSRLQGDQITEDMVGEKAVAGLASSLGQDEVIMGIKVTFEGGLAGILKEGDRVSVVGILEPPMQQMATSYTMEEGEKEALRPPMPAARITVKNLTVAMVPQFFRYREYSEEEEGGFFAPVSSASPNQEGVVLLRVPMTPITVTENLAMSPVEVLALLNAYGRPHLVLGNPEEGTEVEISQETPGVRLDELLEFISGTEVEGK